MVIKSFSATKSSCGLRLIFVKILTLKKHLSLPTATWKDERSSSLRIIAKCYMAQNKPKLAIKYFKQSIIEKPDIREGYYWLGLCYYFFNK